MSKAVDIEDSLILDDLQPASTIIWTLDDALILCRLTENTLKDHGYHVALGGSVLNVGFSSKDVDIFVYPHNVSSRKRVARKTLLKILTKIGYTCIRRLSFGPYDKKIVYYMTYNNKRVDLFFVK